MVLAYHLVLSACGFWLPNDPRGSCSGFVGSTELFRFGKAKKKVDTRESTAVAEHHHAWRRAAKKALKFAPVRFSGGPALAIGRGFARATEDLHVSVCAGAIRPDPVHLVAGRSIYSIEEAIARLKSEADRKLVVEPLRPFQHQRNTQGHLPNIGDEGEWKMFLNSTESFEIAMRYVEDNPLNAGLQPQRRSFMKGNEPH